MIGRVAGIVVVLAAVTACSDDGTYVPTGEGGDSGLLEGTLVVRDGCVVIEDGEGQFFTPVLPVDEVGWNGEELTWRGEAYSPGDPIRLGGGAHGTKPEMATVPAECESDAYFMAY